MCKLYPLNLSLSGFGKCKVNPLGYFKGNIKIDDFKCNADISVVENNIMSYDVIVGMNVLMQGETVINENGIVIKEKFQRIEEVNSLSVLPIDVTPNKVELNIGPDVPNIFKDKISPPINRGYLRQIERIKRLQFYRSLKNAFFHVGVNKDSRKYTSFVTHEGQYQFIKVPFGLCNSPAVFQRYINTIFRPLINDGIVLPYLDDIIILSSSFEEGIERVERVLSIASEYGLEINFNKSHFLKKRIEFLGHVVEDGKIFPSTLKTKAVLNFPEPANLKQIHSFLGLTGYFRKFIPKYSTIARPLSDLLKKDRKFKFGEEKSPDDKNFHPTYYMRIPFKIVTDCSALKKLCKKDLVTRVARWALLLEEFDYVIEHRSGTRMTHVDALSRSPINIFCISFDNILPRLKSAQDNDNEVKAIKELLRISAYENYCDRNGIFYKFVEGKELVVVPDSMQTEIIRNAHERGHTGVKYTEKLQDYYYIPKLRQKVEKIISNCVHCILINQKRGKKEGLLQWRTGSENSGCQQSMGPTHIKIGTIFL
ncbi:Retrovirus-related Pol polyprotein from transposon 297 [Araneus ventricosus]|uniref:RNA-directed DNA polymerase n=1 Tax=Araneus ventricosus TaxID=182803 RepID=A0A4Y2UJ21_ARAVE|nr:Retrovirus-related Pol polyprotein from transposon 297 [Araneus ventricosus]GBO13093.1 Retrovirus-related Pol polyprotein from transposon 297 [Araneus ventricosus]